MILASLSDSITTAIASHGVWAVFGLMALDAVFPAASELVMLYGGALAAGAFGSKGIHFIVAQPLSHVSGFIVIALAGTLGYLVGALIGWAIGRYGGRPLLETRGKWFHLSPKKLDRAEAWFTKWGNLGVALGRITPVVRSFVSIPAGVFEMPLPAYTVLTLIGSAVWSFALAGAGYGFGTNYHRFDHDFRYIEIAVVAVFVLLGAYLVYRRVTKAKVGSHGDSAR